MEDQSAARVVVLGDSFTFGFRVPGGACYPSVLERRLNDELWRERGVDVLNFGVSGYATREEALVLEHKAMRWRPDLIIIGYVLNDPEIDPVQPLTRYFQEPAWWQHFDLLRRLAKVKHQWEINRRGGGDYYRYLHSPEHRRWKSVVAAFGDIQAAAASADVPVLVVIFPESRRDVPWSEYAYLDIHEQVAQAAREHGFEVLDLYEAFSRYEPRTLMVRRRDPHPSTFGHEVAANAIYDWIASVFPGQS